MSKEGVEYFYQVETDDIFFDVDVLANSSIAHSLRDQYQADLVVLLTDGNYGYAAGVVTEIGPNESTAFAIVEVDCATANLTFAHETAHLFGGLHQNDPDGIYEHGYYFNTGWWPFRNK